MSMPIYTIAVVGTTFECRQKRIAALEDGAAVFFKQEHNNSYDPQAIAVLAEDGSHLGYIGRNDPRREEIRRLQANGFVIARAMKIGGFRKYNGVKANLGLRVQYYGVPADYGFQPKDEDEAEEFFCKYHAPIQKRKKKDKRYKDEMRRCKRRFSYPEIQEMKRRYA